MSETIALEVNPRESGKGPARALRRSKYVPAIIYGKKIDPTSVSVREGDAIKYASRHYENTMFKLKSSDKKLNGLSVIRKELVRHKVNKKPIHMDYYAVDVTEAIKVSIEIIFDGEPIGVKDKEGVLSVIRRDIEIECLPGEIPENLKVDISQMDLGDSLHVSDLNIPENLKLITAEDLTICNVSEPKEEEVPEPGQEGAAEGEEAAAAEGAGEEGAAAEGAGEEASSDEGEKKSEE